MNLKSQLLKPAQLTPVTLKIMGGEFPVRRLTAARLNQYDKAIKKHQKTQDGEQLNTCSAQLIIDSVLDENNQPMAESVTAADLMAVHSPVVINAAISAITKLNFLGEDAEEEAKKD